MHPVWTPLLLSLKVAGLATLLNLVLLPVIYARWGIREA